MDTKTSEFDVFVQRQIAGFNQSLNHEAEQRLKISLLQTQNYDIFDERPKLEQDKGHRPNKFTVGNFGSGALLFCAVLVFCAGIVFSKLFL